MNFYFVFHCLWSGNLTNNKVTLAFQLSKFIFEIILYSSFITCKVTTEYWILKSCPNPGL